MFTGLSAFPLTPLVDGEIAEASFVSLIEKLTDAGVNSIGAGFGRKLCLSGS